MQVKNLCLFASPLGQNLRALAFALTRAVTRILLQTRKIRRDSEGLPPPPSLKMSKSRSSEALFSAFFMTSFFIKYLVQAYFQILTERSMSGNLTNEQTRLIQTERTDLNCIAMSRIFRTENSLISFTIQFRIFLLYNHYFTIKLRQLCTTSISILFSH